MGKEKVAPFDSQKKFRGSTRVGRFLNWISRGRGGLRAVVKYLSQGPRVEQVQPEVIPIPRD